MKLPLPSAASCLSTPRRAALLVLFAAALGLRAEVISYQVGVLVGTEEKVHVTLYCGTQKVGEGDSDPQNNQTAIITAEQPDGPVIATAEGFKSDKLLYFGHHDDEGHPILFTVLYELPDRKPTKKETPQDRYRREYVAKQPNLAPAIRAAILQGVLAEGMTPQDVLEALGDDHAPQMLSYGADTHGRFSHWRSTFDDHTIELYFRGDNLQRWTTAPQPRSEK